MISGFLAQQTDKVEKSEQGTVPERTAFMTSDYIYLVYNVTSGEEGGRCSHNKEGRASCRRAASSGRGPAVGAEAALSPARPRNQPGSPHCFPAECVSSWARSVSVIETSRGNSWLINELVMSWL